MTPTREIYTRVASVLAESLGVGHHMSLAGDQFQRMTAIDTVEIAPAAPIHQVVSTIAFARSTEAPGSEIGRNRETPTLDVHRNGHTVAVPGVGDHAHDTGACPLPEPTSPCVGSPRNLRASVRRHRSSSVGRSPTAVQGASRRSTPSPHHRLSRPGLRRPRARPAIFLRCLGPSRGDVTGGRPIKTSNVSPL